MLKRDGKGTKITFNGEGDEREGYSAGDVIFVLKEKKHSQYRREGNDLVFSCEVSLYKLLLEVNSVFHC